MRFKFSIAALFCLAVTAGCGDAVSSGHNTGLDSFDLTTMTNDMAAKIAADPEIQTAIAKDGALKIVCDPVNNQMTGEILPRGQAEVFITRVRNLLAQHDREHFVWIVNRDYYRYMQAKELEPSAAQSLGPNPETTDPQYELTATFSTLTNESDARRSSYYLCAYSLNNLHDRTVLWTGKYEVKKTITKGYLD